MTHQIWFCQRCRGLGVIVIEDGEGDAWGVAVRLRDAHRGANGCSADPQIINLQAIKEDVVLMGHLP